MTDWRLFTIMTGGGGVMTTLASEMHTRNIGLATRNQSALFMMSINWYYVKYVLYSIDSTATQQPASLQLQDIEDTSNDYVATLHRWCYIHLTVRTWTIRIRLVFILIQNASCVMHCCRLMFWWMSELTIVSHSDSEATTSAIQYYCTGNKLEHISCNRHQGKNYRLALSAVWKFIL